MKIPQVKNKGITLIELIISLVLVSFILVIIYAGYSFILRNTSLNMRRSNAYMQMNYALENIRMHVISAARVTTLFPAGHDGEMNNFSFSGESDIYTITPNDLSDNINYSYVMKNGDLVLERNGAVEEALIERDFNPNIVFMHKESSEPNFLEVEISVLMPGQDEDHRIRKTLGMFLWFTDLIQK